MALDNLGAVCQSKTLKDAANVDHLRLGPIAMSSAAA